MGRNEATRKAGAIYRIGRILKTLLEILLQAEGVQKKVLGMQTLFEGMAVGIMDMVRWDSANPLASSMLNRVGMICDAKQADQIARQS
ncbi:MAG: hypothetical protein CL908_09395 [Deltaproteobacteria bacterium]|nr:hypothetical protein [Deltaproteobacteria bacterium]